MERINYRDLIEKIVRERAINKNQNDNDTEGDRDIFTTLNYYAIIEPSTT